MLSPKAPPDPSRIERLKVPLCAGAVALFYWVSLLVDAPIFQSIRGWYWPLKTKLAWSWWPLVPLAAACAAAAFAAIRLASRPWVALSVIALCGWWFQVGLALSDGHGFDVFREQIVSVGHVEFAEVASRESSLLDVAVNYEELLASGRLGKYARSKPPGQLLGYMLIDRAASLGSQDRSAEARLDRLVALAAWLLPILSMLAHVPLYLLARLHLDARAALLACAIFAFAPNVGLSTLHFDHALYPTLFLLPLWLFARSVRTGGGRAAAGLAGALAALALYVTFSLLPLLPICAMLAAAEALDARRAGKPASSALAALASFLVGLLAVVAISRVALGYDILHRYSEAMAAHIAWKRVEFTPAATMYFAALDYLEFAVWAGLPIAVLFADAALSSAAGAVSGDLAPERLWGAILLAVFLLLGMFGKTLAEVARLWLFLVPLVALVVAQWIRDRHSDRFSLAASLLLAAQFVTTYLIKRFQDFY